MIAFSLDLLYYRHDEPNHSWIKRNKKELFSVQLLRC